MLITPKTERFLASEKQKTPLLVVDLSVIAKKYRLFKRVFPQARSYYAVKANSAEPVLRRLESVNASFDVASVGEIESCLAVGVNPSRISFGNTIKKQKDIAKAYSLGVRLFAFDSLEELQKIKIEANGAKVFCRIAVSEVGAKWSFSEKFGCSDELAIELMLKAKSDGLKPCGISFHVGSQQEDQSQWKLALAKAGKIFTQLSKSGISLDILNIGGGFPVSYRDSVPDIGDLAYSIDVWTKKIFGSMKPAIMLEPGRSIAAEAGVLRSEVILVAKKDLNSINRWVYLDIGRFNGLAETSNEAIQYPLRTSKDGSPLGPVIIAGPSCDGADILYKDAGYRLPLDLKSGDFVDILCAGAYTSSYSSLKFNGFSPLVEHYI